MRFDELYKVGSGAPQPEDLVEAGLAIDIANKRVYSKDIGGNIFLVGGTSTYLSDVPLVSSTNVSLNENDTTTITITNYVASNTYVVESLDPLVTVSELDGVITITAGDIDASTNVSIRVNSTESGKGASNWTAVNVTVLLLAVMDETISDTLNDVNTLSSNDGFINI